MKSVLPKHRPAAESKHLLPESFQFSRDALLKGFYFLKILLKGAF